MAVEYWAYRYHAKPDLEVVEDDDYDAEEIERAFAEGIIPGALPPVPQPQPEPEQIHDWEDVT